MNIDNLGTALRKQVGQVHRAFHYDGLAKGIFEARLTRLNSILRRLNEHRNIRNTRMKARVSLAAARRFMAYRRNDIDNGSRIIVILTTAIGWEAFLDGSSFDFDEKQSDDIIVVSNSLHARERGFDSRKYKPVIDLNLTAITLFGDSVSVEYLAEMINVRCNDERAIFINDLARAIIENYDNIADASPNGKI